MESNDLFMWLDDLRDPRDKKIQERYGSTGKEIWVFSVEEAKVLLESGRVVYMSLDHDLGEGADDGSSLVRWIEEESFYGRLKVPPWRIHSDNPAGKEYMTMALKSAEKNFSKGKENPN